MIRFDKQEFKGNPNVYCVEEWSGRLILTYTFRIKLYETWKKNGVPGVLEEMKVAKLGQDKVGLPYIEEIITLFKNSGFPLPKAKELTISEEELNPLIISGKFIRTEKGNGIRITPSFEEELFALYPEMSIEDGIRRAGLDPMDVGSLRLTRIRKNFESRAKALYGDPSGDGSKAGSAPNSSFISSEEENEAQPVLIHPYVQRCLGRTVYMTDQFYNEAAVFKDLGLNRIFEIFEIDGSKIDTENRIEIGAKLHRRERTDRDAKVKEGQALNIFWNQEQTLSHLVAEGFARIGQQLPDFSPQQKRSLCRWIQDLPRDPWGYYTTRRILDKIGMSKSTYYEFLNNENYGRFTERKARRDAEDTLLIRQVVAYKGYQKGYRQVYMMMESVTGQRMSIHRVLNLMRMDGIRTTIRRPSKNRKAMKELIARNGQPNLLDRRFRLYRPNQVRLTDVTYMDYGEAQRAYGSASIDPVTGRLICFVVSESNDLQMALDTLDAMDAYPAEKGGIIHSDQGILYFTDDFQAAVKERDLIQSMSRRGNCWDNAPQESFFGHFKDECKYRECKTLDELRCAVRDYGVYYNEERRMWGRNRMTPVEYESYLLSMSDEEFADYLAAEEAASQKRKEKSAQEAANRARTYRERVEKAQEEYDHGTDGRGTHV